MLILLILLCVLAVHWWPQIHGVAYGLYREQGKVRTLIGLKGYQRRVSPHFTLYHTELDQDVADMVLETAEGVYQPVIAYLGFQPPERIPVILYPSREELRQAFGWGKSESAVGVYWNGTIRLLSPNVWISGKRQDVLHKAFHSLNPIAHELTHYVLDYLTDGNYPRWFTEGLAQYIEHQITGYLWIEPESTLEQGLYTLEELEGRFDRLQNQPLAYRQSYLLVDYMLNIYGKERLAMLIQLLAGRVDFPKAVYQATGQVMPDIYLQWRRRFIE